MREIVAIHHLKIRYRQKNNQAKFHVFRSNSLGGVNTDTHREKIASYNTSTALRNDVIANFEANDYKTLLFIHNRLTAVMASKVEVVGSQLM